MDGLVVPLAENLLIACCDAIEPWLLDWINGCGFYIIDASYAEARNLGINLITLGDDKVLGNDRLSSSLSANASTRV